jgi:hypothetical protein
MSHTQDTTTGAIARSISHDEIVTVRIGAEEDMSDAYDALIADPLCEDHDKVYATATLLEVWGTTEDGDAWRVHLMQAERVGSARFAE